MKYSERLSAFLDFVRTSQTEYKSAFDEVNTKDKQTQDFLHELELGGLTYQQRCKVATQITRCRKERRYYKDVSETLEPLVSFFEDPQNKKVLNELTQILGKMRKQEQYHQNRNYKPRINK
jgi:hypothetical protein